MKTITYNPDTHKLVPIEPTKEMARVYWQYNDRTDVVMREAYQAMLNAAPAAEEAQQPAKDSSATCGSLATHGEPVAYLVYAGVCDMRPVYPAHSTRASAEARAREIKSVTEVRPLFLSPQPTPGHIKTMQQALEALETCDAAHPSDGGQQWYDSKAVDVAITTLQNALKGTT